MGRDQWLQKWLHLSVIVRGNMFVIGIKISCYIKFSCDAQKEHHQNQLPSLFSSYGCGGRFRNARILCAIDNFAASSHLPPSLKVHFDVVNRNARG